MKVKLFLRSDIFDLEEMINLFLRTHDITVKDIKLSCGASQVVALLIYEEKAKRG